MKQAFYEYAILRFSPYIETDEFANAGIVMMGENPNYFGFKFEYSRYKRMTHFFRDLEPALFKDSVKNLNDEMQRVSNMLVDDAGHTPNFYNEMFQEIVRPRETILRFSNTRAAITDNPNTLLNDLFSRYVEHDFATKQYQERLLEKGVRELLTQANVINNFKQDKVGDQAYSANFPFVSHKQTSVNKVIKPLHLGHDKSTEIYNHGEAWLMKIKRLINKQHLQPKQVLLSLSPPEGEQNIRQEAYQEIKVALQNTGVKVITFKKDNDNLLEFARN